VSVRVTERERNRGSPRHFEGGLRIWGSGAKSPMRRIEIEVLKETRDDGERLRRAVEILASGIFSYLQEGGYLEEGEGEEEDY